MEGSRNLADFSRRHGIVSVYLDASKVPSCYRAFDHREDASSISGGMNKREADQPIGVAGHDAGHLLVGCRVVAVKERKHYVLSMPAARARRK